MLKLLTVRYHASSGFDVKLGAQVQDFVGGVENASAFSGRLASIFATRTHSLKSYLTQDKAIFSCFFSKTVVEL